MLAATVAAATRRISTYVEVTRRVLILELPSCRIRTTYDVAPLTAVQRTPPVLIATRAGAAGLAGSGMGDGDDASGGLDDFHAEDEA